MSKSKESTTRSLQKPRSDTLFKRRKTRQVKIGAVPIGGGAPIAVQSMTKTHTKDVEATLDQIKRLEEAGCEIVRLAVPDRESVEALGRIKKQVSVPLVADIHFDHRLALASLEKGVDALRINPGNIGTREKVREVVRAAREHDVPIRIGVNSGSLEKSLLRKHGAATAEAMVESALKHVRILEDMDFYDIKISLKAPDVFRTVQAFRLLADKVDYPFHAGITESGSLVPGSVKSSIGLALLLSEGLADTIRVSLTAPPEEEVRVAFLILSSLGLRSYGPNFVSCPVCGRCEVDLFTIVQEVEKQLASLRSDIHLAVMGCMVNGPGEARESDLGLACGRGAGVLFKKGRIFRRLEEDEMIAEFVKEAKRLGKSRKSKNTK
ncbi:MAG: flavodoxin-dependent (E)-4-hydroxy-3-methylbut-2-enyl-diphosphate synthase [Candidatus Aminicenantes bacterium]|nr:flavodoxin-dependent (E)-4-hydroxy-3-methylbut-2-enyl-diphosphate synthase [Candidatus Aminicenantes bacterium]